MNRRNFTKSLLCMAGAITICPEVLAESVTHRVEGGLWHYVKYHGVTVGPMPKEMKVHIEKWKESLQAKDGI